MAATAADKVIFDFSQDGIIEVDPNYPLDLNYGYRMKAVGNGTTTITVTSAYDPSVTKTIDVTVDYPEVTDLTVTNNYMPIATTGLELLVDGTATLRAGNAGEFTPLFNGSEVVFTSQDPAIIDVTSNDGYGSFTFTAKSAGSTTITASYGDVQKTIPVTIYAEKPQLESFNITFGAESETIEPNGNIVLESDGNPLDYRVNVGSAIPAIADLNQNLVEFKSSNVEIFVVEDELRGTTLRPIALGTGKLEAWYDDEKLFEVTVTVQEP